MFGQEAVEMRNFLQITQPMERGIVKNWDDMKLLWDYTFDEKLKINPQGRRIILTEPPLNPKPNQQRMAQVMFEDYGLEGVYIAVQAVLALYARVEYCSCACISTRLTPISGEKTGVVIDSGDGVTHIVPVYEGFMMPHLTRRLDVAGGDIARHLIKLLLMRGYSFNRTADFKSVREVKEKLCFVRYAFHKMQFKHFPLAMTPNSTINSQKRPPRSSRVIQ